MNDVTHSLEDLLKQATVERSHFYVGSVCIAAIAELSRLNAKISELEKDAMRYQWLRDESYKEPYAPGPAYRSLYDGIGGSALNTDLCRVWLKYGTALDDAIDSQLNVPGNK